MASKNSPRSRGLTSPESQRGSSRGKKGGRGRGGAAVGASLKGSITQYTVPSGLAPPSPSSLRNDIDIENDESTTPDLVGVFPKSPPGFFNGEHPRPIEPSASVFDCASPLQDDSNAATPVSPSDMLMKRCDQCYEIGHEEEQCSFKLMLGIEPWAKVDSYCCSSCQATDLGLTQVVSHVVECATEQDDAASGSVLIEVQAWQGVHRLFLVAEKRASLEQVARVILAEWFDPEFLATSVFWSLRSPAAFSCPVPFDHAKSVAILPDAICSLNSLSSNHRRRWPPDDARAMRAQLVGSFCGVDDTVLSFQCNNTQCLVKLSNLRRRRCRNLLTDDALSIVCRNNPPLIRCAAHPCHNAADVVFSDPPSRSLKSSTGSSFLPIQNFPASQFVCEADAPVTSFSCRISNSPNLRF